ncbi:MAG: hypothetical protein N2116_07595, partial [Armatimonadetes bacterium]|nr:hypothetical protein [Armatimonadota bacterium]
MDAHLFTTYTNCQFANFPTCPFTNLPACRSFPICRLAHLPICRTSPYFQPFIQLHFRVGLKGIGNELM